MVPEKVPTPKEVNHKFLLSGHTHIEVDSKYSVIEGAKNQIKNHTIFTTNEWRILLPHAVKRTSFL